MLRYLIHKHEIYVYGGCSSPNDDSCRNLVFIQSDRIYTYMLDTTSTETLRRYCSYCYSYSIVTMNVNFACSGDKHTDTHHICGRCIKLINQVTSIHVGASNAKRQWFATLTNNIQYPTSLQAEELQKIQSLYDNSECMYILTSPMIMTDIRHVIFAFYWRIF